MSSVERKGWIPELQMSQAYTPLVLGGLAFVVESGELRKGCRELLQPRHLFLQIPSKHSVSEVGLRRLTLGSSTRENGWVQGASCQVIP
jgi:hypothetical protein